MTPAKKAAPVKAADSETENDHSNDTQRAIPLKGNSPRVITVDFTGVSKTTSSDSEESVHDEDLENRRIVPTMGMDFPEEALHGLAGRIVKKLMVETEAHPAALLIHTMLRFGNLIGRTAHVVAEGTRHYANEFAVVVGKSSKSRKGTANDRIADIYVGIDTAWENTNQTSGFGSGEAVISNVRDDQEFHDRGKVRIVPGIEDKRLFVREGEFSKLLNVAQREGNTLSPVLRDAWDGKDLRNNVKHNPLAATEPHISAVCDITIHELTASLKEQERYNGFANRFIFLFVERSRLIPQSRVQFDWTEERSELRSAIAFAKSRCRMFFSEAARRMWGRKYEQLTQEIDGSIGAITGRAEGHVYRLSLIFALLDRRSDIRSEHLKAAMALWDYSMRSVLHIFNTVVLTPAQKRIIDYLGTAGPSTTAQIREELFKRNRGKDEIVTDLDRLKENGLIDDAVEDAETGRKLWQCSQRIA